MYVINSNQAVKDFVAGLAGQVATTVVKCAKADVQVQFTFMNSGNKVLANFNMVYGDEKIPHNIYGCRFTCFERNGKEFFGFALPRRPVGNGKYELVESVLKYAEKEIELMHIPVLAIQQLMAERAVKKEAKKEFKPVIEFYDFDLAFSGSMKARIKGKEKDFGGFFCHVFHDMRTHQDGSSFEKVLPPFIVREVNEELQKPGVMNRALSLIGEAFDAYLEENPDLVYTHEIRFRKRPRKDVYAVRMHVAGFTSDDCTYELQEDGHWLLILGDSINHPFFHAHRDWFYSTVADAFYKHIGAEQQVAHETKNDSVRELVAHGVDEELPF